MCLWAEYGGALAGLFLYGLRGLDPHRASPRPELDAVLHAAIHRIASGVSAASILTLIYLMTARPG